MNGGMRGFTVEESRVYEESLNRLFRPVNEVPIKIRKLHEDARIPTYETDGSAGFDLHAVEDAIIAPGETVKVPLGLAFEIPHGYVMYVMMRSGIALNTNLRQSNGIGVIDSDYRGEVSMMFDNVSRDDWSNAARRLDNAYDDSTRNKCAAGSYVINKGDRVCQAVIQRVEQAKFTVVDELTETRRGTGGFGHSGVSG